MKESGKFWRERQVNLEDCQWCKNSDEVEIDKCEEFPDVVAALCGNCGCRGPLATINDYDPEDDNESETEKAKKEAAKLWGLKVA